MKTGAKFLLLLAGLSLFISACGSSGGGGNVPSQPQAPPPPIVYDYYVDNVNGDDDLNPGTENAPFKTITHAISVAGTNKKIRVLPGTYDETHGEIFPLVLKTGQYLVGDTDPNTRGAGAPPTMIIGSGPVPGMADAAIRGANNAKVSGFLIDNAYTAINVIDDGMEISYNTLYTHDGVRLKGDGDSVVKYNTFETANYGVYSEDACSSCPTIRNNRFLAMDIPIDIHTDAVIKDNIIKGSGTVGIRTSGHPRIEGNTFTATDGYVDGAIFLYGPGSNPTIRGNTFDCKTAVRVDNGNPDLGTATDPGNNDFSDITGVSLTHNGTADITAIGNTWPTHPHSTPLADTDILITNKGSVKWGINEADIYTAP